MSVDTFVAHFFVAQHEYKQSLRIPDRGRSNDPVRCDSHIEIHRPRNVSKHRATSANYLPYRRTPETSDKSL